MSRKWTIADVQRTGLRSDLQEGTATAVKAPPAKPKLPTTSANALTQQALRILDLKGFHCWRQNNGAVYNPVKQVFRKGSSTPGISDVLGFHRRTGLILAAEIKARKDKLSKEQQDFLDAVRKAGGLALVIRTTADIETVATIEIK